MLPFTAEVLLSVLEQYNRAIWPAQIVATGLGLAAVVSVLRPFPGGGRLVGAALAAAWVWIGVAYYLTHMAAIDFTAPALGVLFVIQGALLAWTGALRGRLALGFRADAFGWTGIGLVVFAMAAYPLMAHGWPRAPMVGVAPCPTVIFTIGMLLLVSGRTPLYLVAIPVLGALYCGATAWLLNLPEDLAVPLAGVGGLGLILWKNRRRSQR